LFSVIPAFHLNTLPGSSFPDENSANGNLRGAISLLRSRLSAHNFNTAKQCLDILLQHKEQGQKLRKDNTFSVLHEVRQALAAVSFIENGLVSDQADRYGPTEILVCTTIIHDLGEDFGITGERLKETLAGCNDINAEITDKLACNLEMITYRRNGENVHGSNDQNLYIDDLLENPYALLGKFLDRNDNLATLIGAFSLGKHYDYMDRTEALFSLRNTAGQAKLKFPELSRAFSCADAMMGTLFKLNRFYCIYRPDQNIKTSKRLQQKTAMPVDFAGFLDDAEIGYSFVPPGFHPVEILAGRIAHDLDLPRHSRVLSALQYERAVNLNEKKNMDMQPGV
jgi:hypothetical protein